MKAMKQPVRWLRSYWSDDDRWYLVEVDADGWGMRQIELSGPDRTPVVAASLAEWPDADVDGLAAVRRYEASYGALGDQRLPFEEGEPATWEPPADDIDATEFEAAWARARRYLEARAAGPR